MLEKKQFENALRENPIGFFGKKSASEISDMICEEAGVMVGYDQRNPHHCYDLMTHTLHVVNGVPADQKSLRVAALFHDIGKPSVAFEKQGRLVFYGHPERSAEITAPVLEAFGYGEDEAREILFYIKMHDMFISWVFPDELYSKKNPYLVTITEENLKNHIKKTESKNARLFSKNNRQLLWKNLLILCEADVAAQADTVIQNGKKMVEGQKKLKKFKPCRLWQANF